MKRQILVVDDVPMNRLILKSVLGRDYAVAEAKNGQEALEIIRRDYNNLSAVLLDIVMPVMDGYELLRLVREEPLMSQLPIIVVTGSEEESERVKALSLGANDYIVKPYNPDIIKHCLRNNIALRETESIINAVQRDKMTGLLIREFFFDKADELIKNHEPGYYILFCIDVDNFKLINDQYGTREGDRILKHIGAALKEICAQEQGLCGRISGDNFAGLYPNRPDVIERMTTSHTRQLSPPGIYTGIHFSVGRYLISDLSLQTNAIYDRAFLAKQSVKGRYDENIAYFDESMLAVIKKEQQIISDMAAAIPQRQFEVWFQPQYNHATGALVGSEALVRWRHPERGLIPPGDFIPVFEQNGFVYEVDKYVWRETCRHLRCWLDEGRKPMPVSVNVSRYDIFRENLVDVLTGVIQEYRLPVEMLRLEITESAFAKSSEKIIQVVQQLIDRGFTVEIDDFGSGYSSLNTLKDVPAQVIKLDMRFLEDTKNSQRGGNILESIVRMTKWLGMSVIAEGVETIEQADYLKSIGCAYIQGYLYARPMPADAFENLSASVPREQQHFTVETIKNLNSNAFWNPSSMDTLIFNSYVGGACIYEYHNGKIEILRVNDKFIEIVGSSTMTSREVLKLDWAAHLDPASAKAVNEGLEQSAKTKEEFSGEFLFLDLPGCPHETYLHGSLRVIASADDRHLVYCINENITALHEAEAKRLAATEAILSDALSVVIDASPDVMFLKDAHFRYVNCSSSFLKAAGIADKKDVVGRTDCEIFNHRLADEYRKTDEIVLKGKCKKTDVNTRFSTPEGKIITIRISKYPLLDADGCVIGIFGMGRQEDGGGVLQSPPKKHHHASISREDGPEQL